VRRGRFLAVVVSAAILAVSLAVVLPAKAEAGSTPKIYFAKWWLSYGGSGTVATTYFNVRVSLWDPTAGRLKFGIRETQPSSGWIKYRSRLRHGPQYFDANVVEREYRLKWRAPARLWGGGVYKIRLVVTDPSGLRSKAVFHTWNIGE
jgi:hypothetical protein